MLNNEPEFLHALHSFLTLYKYCRHAARKRTGAELNGRKIALLRYVLEKGRVPQGELGEYLLINKSSTSEILDSLEEAGLVIRSRDSEDGRQVGIRLSDKGIETAESVEVTGIPLLRERLPELPPGELQEFARILDRINAALDIPSDEKT